MEIENERPCLDELKALVKKWEEEGQEKISILSALGALFFSVLLGGGRR